MTLGIDHPIALPLASLPVASSEGCCLAAHAAGSAAYIYAIFPKTATTAEFWRYDTNNDTWQRLADPTLGVNDNVTQGTALVVRSSTGTVYLFNSYTDAGIPQYHHFQAYNPATDAWADVAGAGGTLEAAGLVAAWGNDTALCNPSNTIGSPVDGNIIYLVGNADTGMYIYDILTDTWTAAGGAARGAAPGAGVTLDWVPDTPDALYSARGGGSNLMDTYTISTGAFAGGMALLPTTTLLSTGCETTVDPRRNTIVFHIAGRLYEWHVAPLNATVVPLAHLYLSDGTQHRGRGITYRRVGNRIFFFVRKHTSTAFQRIAIVE